MDVPIPEPPFWGVREMPVDMDEVFPLLDTHVLFKLHWGGKGVKGEAWEAAAGRLPAAPRAHVARAGLPEPARALGYFPVNADGDDLVFFDPDDPARELERLRLPAPAGARPALPGRLLAADRDAASATSCVLQAVTVGPEVTQRCERLEAEGEFAEQLFVHGLGVQTAEGIAEWLHETRAQRARPRASTRAAATPGATRPARTRSSTCRCSSCWAPSRSACRSRTASRVEPEQSTIAIVAHHPQATYFGMKSGRIPPDRAEPAPAAAK